jgi:septal ring factor EnvC (AmiA/AmiB activator)
MKRTLFILTFLIVPGLVMAQKSKKVRALEQERTQLQSGLKKSQNELARTREDAVRTEKTVGFIAGQLDSRRKYIFGLETEIDSLQNEVGELQNEIDTLTAELAARRALYKRSLRSARAKTASQSPLLFIVSPHSFPEMNRRARYANEHAAYQRQLGYRVLQVQNDLRFRQAQLNQAKEAKSLVVEEVTLQRKELETQHTLAKANEQQLRKRQGEIEKRVAEQQKKIAELNKKIDKLIAQEIEQARKREAEQRRKAAAKGKGKGSATTPNNSNDWLTATDRKLNGTLEQNKGRLPVPITGSYRLHRGFGMNRLPSGVMLDNKGVDYMGKAGAQARSVFDGRVTAVFQHAGYKHVLVRHGSYISVYSNLSSVSVKQGQQLKTRDIIGTVGADDEGRFVLQFQLRRETAKLNPSQWIGR